MQATARVMRSYDYNHFEISISDECSTLDDVNELRKKAAVLVDEAVRQYVIAKQKENSRIRNEGEIRRALEQIENIQKIPQSEWTIQQAALMRAYEDKSFWSKYSEDDYYYDDPDRDHHFSMLSKFKDSRISADGIF